MPARSCVARFLTMPENSLAVPTGFPYDVNHRSPAYVHSD